MPKENQVILLILALLTAFYMVLSFGEHVKTRTNGVWPRTEACVLLLLSPAVFVLTWCAIVLLSPVITGFYIYSEIKKENAKRSRSVYERR